MARRSVAGAVRVRTGHTATRRVGPLMRREVRRERNRRRHADIYRIRDNATRRRWRLVAEALRNDEVGDGGHEARCKRMTGRTEGRGTANVTDKETKSWWSRGVVVVVAGEVVVGRKGDWRWRGGGGKGWRTRQRRT